MVRRRRRDWCAVARLADRMVKKMMGSDKRKIFCATWLWMALLLVMVLWLMLIECKKRDGARMWKVVDALLLVVAQCYGIGGKDKK